MEFWILRVRIRFTLEEMKRNVGISFQEVLLDNLMTTINTTLKDSLLSNCGGSDTIQTSETSDSMRSTDKVDGKFQSKFKIYSGPQQYLTALPLLERNQAQTGSKQQKMTLCTRQAVPWRLRSMKWVRMWRDTMFPPQSRSSPT